MNWLAVGKEVGDAAGGVLDAIFRGVDSLVTSDEEREQLAQARRALEQQPRLWQALQNRLEVQHRTVFVAGWRPAVGWVCAFGLAWLYVVHPLLTWLLRIFAPEIEPPPTLDLEQLIAILFAMLGMGTLRTVEKAKGVAK